MSNYDFEIEQLNFTLQHEISMKKNIEKDNEEIENNLNSCAEKISSISQDPQDWEWGRKYLAQYGINDELTRQINLMKEKMSQLSDIKPSETGSSSSPKLNDPDLRIFLRQLEREKRVLEGNLKDIEWRLDSESQELFRITEEKTKYRLELNNALLEGKQTSKLTLNREPVSPIPGVKFSNKSFGHNIKNRHYGIPDNHRILDARKGPVKKTAAVKTLPKIQNLVTPGSADSGLEKSSKLHKLNHYKKIMDENSRIGASTH